MRIAEKKKSQIAALYEQCSGLPADVRSCLENGYFTVTVPPPWNMSNQKVAQEVQDKIIEINNVTEENTEEKMKTESDFL